jgi:hypothetical protein
MSKQKAAFEGRISGVLNFGVAQQIRPSSHIRSSNKATLAKIYPSSNL